MALVELMSRLYNPCTYQQFRCMKTVVQATLLCDKCYFDVDHKSDIKYVFCTRNATHKQAQRNNTEYRLRQKFYYYGLRDLGASEKYISSRVQDLGYHNRTQMKLLTLKNDRKFEGLKEISKRASQITGVPSPLKKLG